MERDTISKQSAVAVFALDSAPAALAPHRRFGGLFLAKYSGSSWALLAVTRWFLAVVVLFGHIHLFAPDNPFTKAICMLGGKASVIGFLMISGISVGYSYISRPEGYYVRRFLRIYPLYAPAIILTHLLIYITNPPFRTHTALFIPGGIKTTLGNLAMLQGFLCYPSSFDGPVWSISCEVFYYMLTPLFFRLRSQYLIGLILGSMVVFHFGIRAQMYGYVAIVYLWAWLLGFFMARHRDRIVAALGLALIGSVLVFLNKPVTTGPLSVLTCLGVFGILLMAPHVHFPQQVRDIMNWLGNVSYPLYLVQFPLCILFYRVFGFRTVTEYVLGVSVGSVIFYYVFDDLLRRIFWMPLVHAGSKAVTRRERPFQ